MTGGEDLAYLIALNEFYKFGPRSMQRLFEVFDSPKAIFMATSDELRKAGIKTQISKEFVEFRHSINRNELLDLVKRNNLSILTILDETYPTLLKEIYDPPTILYIKGALPNPTNQKLISIVGSRKASVLGRQAAKQLTQELVQNKIITVSGLAYGIDHIVHESTIATGGQTIAVLGFGILHKATPREQNIQKKILDSGGCLLSEFPLFMHGAKQNFPIRNRIISGLTHGTLVIEASEKSGSLITARSALEQNHEVFAVPGPITYPTAVGTNNLIKQGAHMVTDASDILHILEIQHTQTAKAPKSVPQGDSPEENKILKIIAKQPTHIDKITRKSELPAQVIATTISLLELKGLVQNAGAQYYSLV